MKRRRRRNLRNSRRAAQALRGPPRAHRQPVPDLLSGDLFLESRRAEGGPPADGPGSPPSPLAGPELSPRSRGHGAHPLPCCSLMASKARRGRPGRVATPSAPPRSCRVFPLFAKECLPPLPGHAPIARSLSLVHVFRFQVCTCTLCESMVANRNRLQMALLPKTVPTEGPNRNGHPASTRFRADDGGGCRRRMY